MTHIHISWFMLVVIQLYIQLKHGSPPWIFMSSSQTRPDIPQVPSSSLETYHLQLRNMGSPK